MNEELCYSCVLSLNCGKSKPECACVSASFGHFKLFYAAPKITYYALQLHTVRVTVVTRANNEINENIYYAKAK